MARNFSIQKKMIVEALMRLDHPTAAQIHQEVAKTYAGISLGTVYRNINQMLEEGSVGRLMLPGEPDRFEPLERPHAHAICSCCGQILDIFSLPEETVGFLARQLEETTGFSVYSHSLSFRGQCSDCRGKKGKTV